MNLLKRDYDFILEFEKKIDEVGTKEEAKFYHEMVVRLIKERERQGRVACERVKRMRQIDKGYARPKELSVRYRARQKAEAEAKSNQ